MSEGEQKPEQLKQTGEIKSPKVLEDKMNWMWGIIIAIIVILVVGFTSLLATVGSLVWNAHIFGANTYQSLEREVHDNTEKLNLLIKDMNKLSTSISTSSAK